MSAAAPVKLDDLLTAVEWVSGEGAYDHSAYVSRTTGGVHLASAGGELDEELPADVDDERLYVEVPSRSDLGLGRNLVLRFVEAKMPDAYNRVRAIFSKAGAYSRYKALLEQQGQLEAWYQYESQAVEQIVREWCEDNGLLVTK